MNIEESSDAANEPTERNPSMQAAPNRGSSGSSRSSSGGSRSRSGASRSSSHGGRNASGAATDKEAQRRGGQHSHGGR